MSRDEHADSAEVDSSSRARISLTLAEVSAIKRRILEGRPYTDRVSFGFCLLLLEIRQRRNEDNIIIAAMDALEGSGPSSTRRPPQQFKHPPLKPFFHKHVFMPRHVVSNIGAHWGLLGADKSSPATEVGNSRFDKMIRRIAQNHGDDPERWQAELAHEFIMSSFEWRSSKGLTGDWLIYAIHENVNYYIGYSTHTKDDQALYQFLKNMSAAEFPWLFPA
jgi:hypothetical protein